MSQKPRANSQKLKTSHQPKYVLIGNSAAAVGAIEAIREYDQETPIKVISKEPYFVYSRPLISYFLAGKVTAQKMHYRPKDFYKKYNVQTILGKKAVAIDPKKKTVLLENKKQVSYDKLLIATGGVPFVPEIKGLDHKGVFTFTNWDDVKEIAKRVSEMKKVVIVGGGLIGLKAAEALKELDVEIVVVELAERALSPVLDKKASQMVEKHLKEVGIEIITNNTVTEIIGTNAKVNGVILRDAQTLDCDAVITAIGIVPNIELVKGTNIQTNKGILVDDKMQTNVVGIYAAGDVTEAPAMLTSDRRVIPIWPGAYEQGQVAGSNMAGQPKKYPGGLPMNSLEFFGLPTISVGLFDPAENKKENGYEVLTRYDAEKRIYKKIVLKDNVAVGAIFVGDIDRSGIVTGLIKDKVEVRNFKENLLKDDFGFVSFPRELREKKLHV